MAYDRKTLPSVVELPFQFDTAQLMSEFVAAGFDKMREQDDLNNPESAFYKLAVAYRTKRQELFSIGPEQKTYWQISLTEYNLAYGMTSQERLNEIADTRPMQLLKAADRNSPDYVPELDYRNYDQPAKNMIGSFFNIWQLFGGRHSVGRMRFAVMEPGYEVKMHIDGDTDSDVKVHIPILTNDDTLFLFKRGNKIEEHNLRAGQAYFINSGVPHAVKNQGTERRIHILINLKQVNFLKEYLDAALL